MKQITVRIYLRDWWRCRRILKPLPKESAARYFERLAEYLENEKQTIKCKDMR